MDCPGHPGSCETGSQGGFLGRRSRQGQRSALSLSAQQDAQRVASPFLIPGLALVHAHPTPGLALFLPPEMSFLTPLQNHPTSKSRFKFLHLQEASNRNITRVNMKSCIWVPELRGCGFTYFVRGRQSTVLASGFCVRGVKGLPKIHTNSGHITRGLWEWKSLCSLDKPGPARNVMDASGARPGRGARVAGVCPMVCWRNGENQARGDDCRSSE